VHETSGEVAALQALLDESYVAAGAHLTSIVAPATRLRAPELIDYLVGVRHLVVATAGTDGTPFTSGVDSLFIRGRFWFTTVAASLKARHLEVRPALSATHLVGDTIGIWVHGRARVVRGATLESAALAPVWRAHYGSTPDDWVERPENARYVEIEPIRMFAYCHDREALAALRVTRTNPSGPP
jgi:Pyridoxamine 5'-phosphate oxidase